MDKTEIERILRDRFHPSFVEVVDDSHKHAGHSGAEKSGGHYSIVIIAESFKGQTTLQRHRMVYDALSSHWQGNIHALAVKADVPF